MNKKSLASNLTLLCTSLIWGIAFSAQKEGMKFVGPMLFNGVRFLLGALVLLPLLLSRKRFSMEAMKIAIPAGLVLFGGAALQQIGIVYTTASNAGFITGLYIVLVPILGIFLGHKIPALSWLAVALSLVGLFLLSVSDGFRIGIGDLLVLSSALFWAIHVLIIDRAASKHDPICVAFFQYLICAFISLVVAWFGEDTQASSIQAALPAIVYGGVMSVALAYTLQIYGQRHAHPVYAALIFSLEGIFAALSAFLFLGETLTIRQIIGSALMLSAIFLSQGVGKKPAATQGVGKKPAAQGAEGT